MPQNEKMPLPSLAKPFLSTTTNNDIIYDYIKQVNAFPILTEEEEKSLLSDFFSHQNKLAGKKVVNSHLRLVVKIASKYKKFHSSLMDLIAEGNLGLLKALKNFSLEKKVRFATYAILWIKASIKAFLLSSLSSIKIGTTNSQKKIIFGLSKVKKYLGIKDIKNEEDLNKVAHILNVTPEQIRKTEMMMYQTNELSLNDTLPEDDKVERGESIASENLSSEEEAILSNSNEILKSRLEKALSFIPKRDSEIIKYRLLNPKKYTLSYLSQKFNISAERVRQVQSKSLLALKEFLNKQNVDMIPTKDKIN